MDPLHPLLRAQLERHHVLPDPVPESWQRFLAEVSETYRAADRHLHEEQRLLESLANGFAGLFWMADTSGRLLRWNRNLEALTGASPERLTESDFLTLVTPEDRQLAADALGRIHQGETLTFECGILNRAGSPIPHRLVGRSILLDDQPVLLAAGFDSSERRRAADALAFSQERFALAMEAANDGLWDWHIPTDKGYFSPRYCAMLGYQPEELIPGHACWSSLLHPDDRDATERHLLDYLRGSIQTYEAEFRMRTRDGSWVWILSRGRIIEHDPAGHPIRVMGTHSDITDRKNAEQRLRESEERLRQAIRIAGVGLFDHDHKTDSIYWSPELRTMIGFGPDEPRAAADLIALVDPADREALIQAIQRSHDPAGDGLFVAEYRIPGPDATSPRWLAARGQSFFSEDGPLRRIVRSVGAAIDVTLRKEDEARMALAHDVLETRVAERTRELAEAKQAAEAASEAKSRFLAMMSHEIRTPLNGVTGVLHLLGRESLTNQQRHWIGIASTSANALLHVINDILDFSKVEAGKLDLHPVPTNLPQTIRDTAETFVPKMVARGLEWRLHIDPAIPTLVEADPNRVAQIIGNLLGNAVKFTETGSIHLDITTLPAHRSTPRSTHAVRIRFTVTDTGPGIPPADQARLFKPFTQIDNSATRRHGGTGLGLGICKHLVRLMGGDIGLSSTAGQGTVFWFEIPFRSLPNPSPESTPAPDAPPQPASPRIQDPPIPLAPRHRVLVAEDNEINQELAQEMLRFANCDCDCVADGLAAVTAASSGRYDLVFMDCMMPGLGGTEATRRIRTAESAIPDNSHPGRRHVIIVAMTANAMAGDREACLAAGMDDYLSKPLDPDEVIRTVHKWLPSQPPQP